eukprot:2725222-Pyramimonas_sp.AAC.1
MAATADYDSDGDDCGHGDHHVDDDDDDDDVLFLPPPCPSFLPSSFLLAPHLPSPVQETRRQL